MSYRPRCDWKILFSWILTLLVLIWYLNLQSDLRSEINKLKTEMDVSLDSNNDMKYNNRSLPLIFIGGVPRSGTTLMRAMLDAHPDIRCGEETRVLPWMIGMRYEWTRSPREKERLENAGVTQAVIDSAVAAFILDVIVNHGSPAPYLCNKDPLMLSHMTFIKSIFPNGRFIFMIRDGRATVHSIISRGITISGFNLTSYRDCLSRWNMIVEKMFNECIKVGTDTCLMVYYEQLVLHPEPNLRRIFQFLGIEWNEAVLHHEKFIGDEVSVSETEKSTDQIVKPVNLEALSKWVGHIPEDVVADMDKIAPMLRFLGYDPNEVPPNYDQSVPMADGNIFSFNNSISRT